jgi:hypothetical protein
MTVWKSGPSGRARWSKQLDKPTNHVTLDSNCLVEQGLMQTLSTFILVDACANYAALSTVENIVRATRMGFADG